MKYKIIHNQKNCIGCGACVSVCSKFFKMSGEGDRAVLIEPEQKEGGVFEMMVSDSSCAKEAADFCPLELIKIISE